MLEMMLTVGQMMLCLAAQMKKSKSKDLDFLARHTVSAVGKIWVYDEKHYIICSVENQLYLSEYAEE